MLRITNDFTKQMKLDFYIRQFIRKLIFLHTTVDLKNL